MSFMTLLLLLITVGNFWTLLTTIVRVIHETALCLSNHVPIYVLLANFLLIVGGRLWVDYETKANFKVDQNTMLA